MAKLKEPRENVLDTIVDIELAMFKNMNTQEPLDERTFPTFKKMRWMTYSVFSDDTLALLLNDWIIAVKNGRNLLIEKYGMIGGQIRIEDVKIENQESSNDGEDNNQGFLGENTFSSYTLEDKINFIVEQESKWQDDVAKRYPKTIQRDEQSKETFRYYLYCELHTWSAQAIESYYNDVKNAQQQGLNLSEQRYNNLYESIGRGSIEEVEKDSCN